MRKFIDTFETPSDTPGIYGILNIVTGRIYVGSSVRMRERWQNHRWMLRQGRHHCVHLQNSWDKHGEENFSYFVLASGMAESNLHAVEDSITDEFRSCPEGVYNLALTARTGYGPRHPPEVREKISIAVATAFATPEAKEKLRRAHLGKTLSDRTREKISAKNSGKRRSEECRAKMSLDRKGKPQTPGRVAGVAKMAATIKGRPLTPAQVAAYEKRRGNPTDKQLEAAARRRGVKLSSEVRVNMSAAQKGRPKSAEHKAKLSAALSGRAPAHTGFSGKKHSTETKAKISASLLARRASAA
ncbi:GIY-YIG nuclease family protein [Sphingopyxis indica]|uniref:NUMOD3 domain-containing DNA-binding protein n=1 Tax=Sphingopyxis indica TaxID=436663 RepID=UPI002938DE3E|nr:NUMOD3 domain-containing DNA-binding protein [Sphingopyxis indica]WOF44367.1 GIY-YIG nuclease family protein [Sphingopyxis indica]